MSKVFISRKNTDSLIAEKVARRVRANGLSVYLDTIDDALTKDGSDLADHLLRRMGQCQQLIAVVSSATKTSWWVPWEIGVGAEKGFRMALCGWLLHSKAYLIRFVHLSEAVMCPACLRGFDRWPQCESRRQIGPQKRSYDLVVAE